MILVETLIDNYRYMFFNRMADCLHYLLFFFLLGKHRTTCWVFSPSYPSYSTGCVHNKTENEVSIADAFHFIQVLHL